LYLAFQNKRTVYAILFRAAADAMRDIAADPKHLGAEIGAVTLLHTWGQTLQHHPHLHCIVPGGGIAPDGIRWVACRPGFFLPVHVLSRRFRSLFLARLQRAFAAGELHFSGTLAALVGSAAFAERLDALRAVEWVVYAKRPFAGPLNRCWPISAAILIASPSRLAGHALDVCPDCGGAMLERGPLPRHPKPHAPFWCDSS
jgi:hypothetical protein